ncbi:DUF4149 domain-containing protein [Rubrivivax sp. RP6-9]|uniref:DUF4149 domain-containing protein n=1 Tax=Rubrivivax sp. RP6-9 TaxID=3415750 RepID=UPI003CC581AC
MTALDRWRRLLPALWAGWLLCVAGLATPAPFATLVQTDAGRVVARMLAQEAGSALFFGGVLLLLARVAARRGGGPQFSVDMGLALGAIVCTVAGYYAVQPMMVAARAGQGALSFGQLHAVSAAFYLVKLGLVLALAWRASRAPVSPPASS